MRKFSLAYLTLPGIDPVTQIRIAAECGYDYVSLRTIPLHLAGEPEFLLHKDKALMRNVKQAIREYSMPVMDIELARIREDLDVSEYEPAFEAAAEIGATDVLGSIWTGDEAYYSKKVAAVADMAAKYNLNYSIEFLTWAGVRNLAEAKALVDKLERPNLYCLVDTLHAHRSHVSADEIAKCGVKYFRFIHLCDGPYEIPSSLEDPEMLRIAREARQYPGSGGIDIAGMVHAMPGLPISIELPNLRNIAVYGFKGHARLCLEAAKEYLSYSGLKLSEETASGFGG